MRLFQQTQFPLNQYTPARTTTAARENVRHPAVPAGLRQEQEGGDRDGSAERSAYVKRSETWVWWGMLGGMNWIVVLIVGFLQGSRMENSS